MADTTGLTPLLRAATSLGVPAEAPPLPSLVLPQTAARPAAPTAKALKPFMSRTGASRSLLAETLSEEDSEDEIREASKAPWRNVLKACASPGKRAAAISHGAKKASPHAKAPRLQGAADVSSSSHRRVADRAESKDDEAKKSDSDSSSSSDDDDGAVAAWLQQQTRSSTGSTPNRKKKLRNSDVKEAAESSTPVDRTMPPPEPGWSQTSPGWSQADSQRKREAKADAADRIAAAPESAISSRTDHSSRSLDDDDDDDEGGGFDDMNGKEHRARDKHSHQFGVAAARAGQIAKRSAQRDASRRANAAQ
ncbi:hypothetical protein M885DRAFT_589795 [Pelagophyceae sp. CCMP2097]|nr:hypothetical protein M885DRAFT_589795 [Pelagophyceae sp. CCMP2097]